MSQFILLLSFPREQARRGLKGLTELVSNSPYAIRSYRYDPTHYKQWLELHERLRNGAEPKKPPAVIKFPFHLMAHADAKRRWKRRKERKAKRRAAKRTNVASPKRTRKRKSSRKRRRK